MGPPPRPALRRRGSGWWKRRSLRRKQETTPMAKLTDAQLIILSTAAQREDGAVLPLAKGLKLQAAAATRVLGALLKAKLLAEQPAALDAPAWRTAKNGRRFALAITAAGRQAIGVDGPEAEAPEAAGAAKQPRRRAGAPKAPAAEDAAASDAARPASKQAQVIALLRRPEGATVEALMEATGWQRHTVRGAISGALKKKLGLAIAAEMVEGRGRVYRISAA